MTLGLAKTVNKLNLLLIITELFIGIYIESYCLLKGSSSTDFKSRNFIGYIFFNTIQ